MNRLAAPFVGLAAGTAIMYGAILVSRAVAPPPQVTPQVVSLYDQSIELPGASGVVVAPGKVLTAAHVVQAWRDGGMEVAFAVIHPDLDIALVDWPTDGKTAAHRARYWTKRGQKVSLVGFVQRRSEVHTRGHTGYLRGRQGESVHSCPSGPGTSGSPLFDEDGLVVGIHTGAFLYPVHGFPQVSTAEGIFVEMAAINDWVDGLL
jgi:hypothetical protein